MQTSREVIEGLFGKGKAERVALRDSPWRYTLQKWVDQGYPTDDEGNPVTPEDHFGFDMAACGGGFDWHPIQGFSEVEEETDEWEIVRNGSGAAFKRWKNKSGTPEHMDFRMASREVWDRDYRPHLIGTAAERIEKQIDAVRDKIQQRHEQGFWTCFGSRFVWECMRGSMGDVTLYESMLLDPDWIHDYCRVYTDLMKDCLRILFDRAGKPEGMWLFEDLGYKQRLFCSPKMYGELIFPYYAEMVEFLHDAGVSVILHSCGFTEPALDMIVEAGFDALHPMEVKAGNDPLRIAEKYGDRLCLIGGLDARVLESGEREHIRREVTNLVEGMKSRGARYIYCSDHSISTNVDYDDFCFAIDVYRECMWY